MIYLRRFKTIQKMKRLLLILAFGMLAGCATVAPSSKAVDKVVSGHTIYFTVLEDCAPAVEGAEPVCNYSAVEIIDDLGIVDNMQINGHGKIGIDETDKEGIWVFVRSTANAKRTINLNQIAPLRRIQSLEK